MTQNKYWIFLEQLRRSGVTNMWGAASNLMDEFDLSEEEACKILADWIGKHNPEDYEGLDE